MMDAIILCRISDVKQEDGFSLDAQERFGVEYCKRKQLEIRQIFRFVETGSKSNKREKFDGMLDYIRDYVGGAKDKTLHLVVEKPDRLTRNFTNREQLQFFVMTGKLVIHYYKDRKILDRNCSPADIFTDDMMTSVSKYIALNIAREAKKGMKEKAKSGWFPGHAPFGYVNIREGADQPEVLLPPTMFRISSQAVS
jgi:site-specific DNA recombinase